MFVLRYLFFCIKLYSLQYNSVFKITVARCVGKVMYRHFSGSCNSEAGREWKIGDENYDVAKNRETLTAAWKVYVGVGSREEWGRRKYWVFWQTTIYLSNISSRPKHYVKIEHCLTNRFHTLTILWSCLENKNRIVLKSWTF